MAFTLLSLQPVEREPLIYHLERVCHRSEDDAELPDEFFEVTVDDVRKRFSQLKSERLVDENEHQETGYLYYNILLTQGTLFMHQESLTS